jgi:hypothetical protein
LVTFLHLRIWSDEGERREGGGEEKERERGSNAFDCSSPHSQKQKISAQLNLQAIQYPVSHNPHFVQVRLKALSREAPKVVTVPLHHHDKDREKKERREREKRERDEKKREKERSKMEKKREKGIKKGMRLPGKKMGKADLKKELKREMQKEWEEELERERGRDRHPPPSILAAESSSTLTLPLPAETPSPSSNEQLHSSARRSPLRRRLEPR